MDAMEAGIQLCNYNISTIPYDIVTCENMADYLTEKLCEITGVVAVSFELREGPSQGVVVV